MIKFGEYLREKKKITRLQILRKELEEIKNMKTLSLILKKKAILYYETEIEAIVSYGDENDYIK